MSGLPGGRLYLDTNVFVYAFEGYEPFQSVLVSLFDRIERGETKAVTSELTVAEVLIGPLRTRNDAAVSLVERSIVDRGGLSVASVSRKVLIAAARLRADSRIKLPDAIHAATATLWNCDRFLTNDKGLKTLPLDVRLLSDLVGDSSPGE